MSKIKSIKARQILDSRGDWTVEVELTTEDGVFRAGVPSGASRGKYEAVALDAKTAVKNINEVIALKLEEKDITQQKEIDNFLIKLDGTENKSNLGANAICGVSIACCRAGAAAQNHPLYQYISQLFFQDAGITNSTAVENVIPIPKPCFNIINGGMHAGNELDFQEFMIAPQMESFSENLQIATEIYHQLKEILEKKFGKFATNLGDEGGFAPPVRAPEEAIKLILEAARNLGCQDKIKIILDIAASQFFKKETYRMRFGTFTKEGLLNYYADLIKKYPIVALEDPFGEEDWQSFQEIIKKFGKKITIIGDDLLVTNPKRIKEAQEKKACNGLLLKINQIGTVTEAIEAVKLAKSFGWKIMVSHRSGETCDDFIADLAVGVRTDYIKAGAPARGERVAKYNRLLKIEEELYAKINFIKTF